MEVERINLQNALSTMDDSDEDDAEMTPIRAEVVI